MNFSLSKFNMLEFQKKKLVLLHVIDIRVFHESELFPIILVGSTNTCWDITRRLNVRGYIFQSFETSFRLFKNIVENARLGFV
jgi:hypothetical protein